MKVSLDALLVLDAIERKSSLAAAAQELFRVPSAITYTVRKLEEDSMLPCLAAAASGGSHTCRPRTARRGPNLLRAARNLEARVKRVATGREAELTIALSDILPIEPLRPHVKIT
jgi:molybdenum-dependent DNA-binding transcriptional regulator ModE